MMKINTVLVADFAKVDPSDGKLDILGVFRQITVECFPVTLSRVCLVIIVQQDLGESTESYRLEAFMEDADGETITTIEATYQLPEGEAISSEPYGVICEFTEPTFDVPGDYKFGVRLNDGEITESVVIEVVQREI